MFEQPTNGDEKVDFHILIINQTHNYNNDKKNNKCYWNSNEKP